MLVPALLTETTADRADAFTSAIRAVTGREPARIRAEGFTPAAGSMAIAAHLAADPACDSVFAVTDSLALGAFHGIKQSGRRVHDDVGVVGVGDTEHADFFDPPLTCVGPVYDQVVAEIVTLLFNLMSRRRVRPVEVFVPPTVARRTSA